MIVCHSPAWFRTYQVIGGNRTRQPLGPQKRRNLVLTFEQALAQQPANSGLA